MAYKRPNNRKSSFKKIIILSVLVIALATGIIVTNRKEKVFVSSRAYGCADDYKAGYCGDWETTSGEHYVVNDDKTGWDLYEPGGSYKGSESAVDHRSYWDNKASKTYDDFKQSPDTVDENYVPSAVFTETGQIVINTYYSSDGTRYDEVYDEDSNLVYTYVSKDDDPVGMYDKDGNLVGTYDENGYLLDYNPADQDNNVYPNTVVSDVDSYLSLPIVTNDTSQSYQAYFPIASSGVTGTVTDKIIAILEKFPVAAMKTVAKWLIGMTIF